MSETEFGILTEKIAGLTTLVNAQFQSTHERLDKINGKVQKHEDQIAEALIERAKNRQEQKDAVVKHFIECPNVPKIRALEDNMLTQKSIKKWIVASIALTGTLIAMVFSILKIFNITI